MHQWPSQCKPQTWNPPRMDGHLEETHSMRARTDVVGGGCCSACSRLDASWGRGGLRRTTLKHRYAGACPGGCICINLSSSMAHSGHRNEAACLCACMHVDRPSQLVQGCTSCTSSVKGQRKLGLRQSRP